MSHCRLWRFSVRPEREQEFVVAYGPDGEWARLFRTADGFVRTELWRTEDGRWITADHWVSRASFDRFQAEAALVYAELDQRLEPLCDEEEFVAAMDQES